MRNLRVRKEIEKILQDESSYPYPLNVAMAASWLLINLKGVQIKILKTAGLSSLCDYFILASAQNPMQAETMIEWVSMELKAQGLSIRSREGNQLSDWLLLDIGDVIIHIFLESARDHYQLDQLWALAPSIAIPENFYYDTTLIEQEPLTESDSSENYF